MRKNIYVRDDLVPIIRELVIASNNKSFSKLIDYLVRKEYKFFIKYKCEDLTQAQKQVSREKLTKWAESKGMTLMEAQEIINFNWLEQEGD